jgi:hypothetical protein
MTTTVNLRKLLHRKAWELATPATSSTNAGSFIAGDKAGVMPTRDCFYFVNGVSSVFNYNADEDSWLQLPNSGIAGAYTTGACGEFRALGALGGAFDQAITAGTTTTLTTNKTVTRNLKDCVVRVISGTGVGYSGKVTSNTIGSNSVLTVTPANGVAFDATTVFRIWSGSLWFFNPGTSAVGFSVYDRATNAWTAKSVTNLPTSWGTTGQLISTPSSEQSFETGTSTGSNTTTTLIQTTKAWATNCWTNYQVRVTGGTGIGQIRLISSNTGTTLTVSSAWAVTPDATSTYSIEGNDDVFYLLGNNAVTLYKYIVSTNTWSTITPGSARPAALGAGGSADWVAGVKDTDWDGGKGLTLTGSFPKQNGRYIYSFRGAGTSALDIYDITGNTWVAVAYGNQNETFTTGSSSVDYNGNIFITKEGTGRVFKFDVAKHEMLPLAWSPYPQSTTVEGDKMIIITFKDGTDEIPFLYMLHHTRTEFLRMLLI